MTFRETKPGYQVYILHRSDRLSVTTGKVISVTQPRVPSPQPGLYNPSSTQQLVVDVTIDDEGVTHSYTIPESHSTTYAGTDLVLSTTRDGILHEVEAMKASSEEAISKVEQHKSIVQQCDNILSDWNPAIREKRETEERFGKIETVLTDMSQLLKSISAKIS